MLSIHSILQFAISERFRLILEGLVSEENLAESGCRESINTNNIYNCWSKGFWKLKRSD